MDTTRITGDLFPQALLSESAEDRLAYFVGKVVAHPRLKEAHLALLDALREPARAPLILVFGPTGVGKTTLRRRIEKQLIEEAMPSLELNPGRIPVVAIEAPASDSGQFNWKDYYTRALLALDEPLIEQKVDYASWSLQRGRTRRLALERAAPAPELRRALEQSLRNRRPKAFILDEAQHLGRTASGRRLLDHMDTLKSLATLSDTVHVLVGTYELLELVNLSAQLSRRSIEIHFGRYQADSATDLQAFKSTVLTFQRHLPLAKEPDLIGSWEYLYEHSVGCIGVLKGWLNRALDGALAADEPTLTRERLARHEEPTRKLLSLAREIKEGEEALEEDGQEESQLRALLGLRVATDAPSGTGSGALSAGGTAKAESSEVRTRRAAGRVGQRRPTRDPVGTTKPEEGAAGQRPGLGGADGGGVNGDGQR